MRMILYIMANSKEGLQRAIDYMYTFCDRWKRRTNISKYTLACNGKNLEIVHNFKYLGILFNFNGSFKLGIEEL